jgi:hypothetical protein
MCYRSVFSSKSNGRTDPLKMIFIQISSYRPKFPIFLEFLSIFLDNLKITILNGSY